MEAKEFLMTYLSACRTLDSIEEQIIRTNQKLLYKSTSYENVGGGSGGSSERTAYLTARIEELEEQLNVQHEVVRTSLSDINAILVQLDSGEHDVLFERYLRGRSFESISQSCRKSFSWCHKKHADGLDSVQELIG